MFRIRRHGRKKFFPAQSGKRTLGRRYRYLSWLWNEDCEKGTRAKEKRETKREVDEETKEDL